MAGIDPIAGGESTKDHAGRRSTGVDPHSTDPFGSRRDNGQSRDAQTDTKAHSATAGHDIRETDQNTWRDCWQGQEPSAVRKSGGRAADIDTSRNPQTAPMGGNDSRPFPVEPAPGGGDCP